MHIPTHYKVTSSTEILICNECDTSKVQKDILKSLAKVSSWYGEILEVEVVEIA